MMKPSSKPFRSQFPNSIQIMQDKPDVMINHNNTLNQAPRGRQKKRSVSPSIEHTEKNSYSTINDTFCDLLPSKVSRSYQHMSSSLSLTAGSITQAPSSSSSSVSFPRILKRDFRRVFGQMYLNVLNSGDPILFARFMRQYVNYNAQYQRYVVPNTTSNGTEQSRDIPMIIGRDAIMYFLASHHETAPDTITFCHQGSIRQHLYSPTSEIVLKVKMAGTRLYMVEWQELLQLMTATTSSAASATASSTPSTASFLEDFRGTQAIPTQSENPSSSEITELALLHFTNRMKRVMLTSPAKFEMECTFTLYLDESFNVYRFDFARHSLQLEEVPELSRQNPPAVNPASSFSTPGSTEATTTNSSLSSTSSAHWITNPPSPTKS
jgi:hypothetical protein